MLTIVPLTSKYHKYHLDLEDTIKKSIYNEIYLNLQNVLESISRWNEETSLDEINETNTKLEMCNQVSSRYHKLKEHTYAKVHQITTISKKRILKPVNQYDPIRKLTVTSEVMDMIDKKFIELFTKVDIK